MKTEQSYALHKRHFGVGFFFFFGKDERRYKYKEMKANYIQSYSYNLHEWT